MFPILNISARTLRNIKLIIHSLVYLLRFKSRFLIRAGQSTLKILKSWVLQIRQSELTNLGARQRDKILSGARLVWISMIFIAYTKTIQIYTFVNEFLIVGNTKYQCEILSFGQGWTEIDPFHGQPIQIEVIPVRCGSKVYYCEILSFSKLGLGEL